MSHGPEHIMYLTRSLLTPTKVPMIPLEFIAFKKTAETLRHHLSRASGLRMLKWIKKLGIQLLKKGNGSKSVDKSETSFSMARIMHSARAGVSTRALLIL